MSGGSYDYAYQRIDELAHSVAMNARRGNPVLRQAFAAHLEKCAKAAKAIEWNDSGDGDIEEDALIRACLPADAELKQAIIDANAARERLNDAVLTAQTVIEHRSIK